MKERPILFSAPMVRALLKGSKTQTRRMVSEKHAEHIEWMSIVEEDLDPDQRQSEVVDLRYAPWMDETDNGKQVQRNPEWLLSCTECMEEGCIPVGQLKGAVGDRLWVRETWAQNQNQTSDTHMDTSYRYRADGEDRAVDNGVEKLWRPSIFMPRKASRIILEITGVRVERLHDISEQDAIAEGVEPNCSMIDHSNCTEEDHGGEWIDYLNMPDGDPCLSAKDSFGSLWESINGKGAWEKNPWLWVIEFKRITEQ